MYKLMGKPKYRVKTMLHWNEGEDDVIKSAKGGKM